MAKAYPSRNTQIQTQLDGIEVDATPSSKAQINRRNPYSGHSELVIAFVAPLGVDLEAAEGATRERLEQSGYTVIAFKLTETVLPKLDVRAQTQFPDAYTRIDTMMDVGNDAREKFGNDILAYGVAAHISSLRTTQSSRVLKQHI